MIVIVDFGMGNLRSVEKALHRLHAETIISSDAAVIETAGKLILPGIGHFARGMEKLNSFNLINILNKKVLEDQIPVLGICLGMQLFASRSEEGNTQGLNWLDAQVVKIQLTEKDREEKKLKIPHMGWNSVQLKKKSSIFNRISPGDSFYFVHSYHVACENPDNILTMTEYGIRFVSALQKHNIVGVQFHPEKSHSSGLRLLNNFIEL